MKENVEESLSKIRTDDFQVILVWTPGKISPIHDHANSHCVMKVYKDGPLSMR